ncbi:unnamed protein product [Closterium sp. Yama58-4]|nr:unnamed protein product [Closterium sp. Yama58-4]
MSCCTCGAGDKHIAPPPSSQVGPGALPRLGHALLATKNAVRAGSGNVRGESAEEWSGMFAADSRRRVWPNGAEVENQNSMVWMPSAFSGAQPALADEELAGLDDQERPYFRYPTAATQKASAAAQGGTTAARGTLAGSALAASSGTNAESREAKPGVIELSAATLPHVLRLRPTLVMFYAPWCPYCQRMEAAWAALAEKLHQESFNVQVARVDAYRYPELTDKYKIPGFPTLMLFNGERPVATHRGRRNLEALFSFVEKHF